MSVDQSSKKRHLFRRSNESIGNHEERFDDPLHFRPLWWNQVLFCSCIFAVILVFVFGFFRFPEVETVSGFLRFDGAEAKIVSRINTRISSCLFQLNERVEEGQVMVQVSSEEALEDGTLLQAVAIPSVAERLDLEGSRLDGLRDQLSIFLQSIDSKRSLIEARSENLEGRLLIARERKQVAQMRLNSAKTAFELGLVSEDSFLQRKEAMTLIELESLGIDEEVAIQRNELELLELEKQMFIETNSEAQLVGLQNIASLRSELAFESLGRSNALVSPISGKVAVNRCIEGGHAAPGTTLYVITPFDSDLVGFVRVDSSAIGMLRVGQSVKLEVDAYSHRRYGPLGGKVAAIASVPALQNSFDTTTEATGYDVLIQINEDEFESIDSVIKLASGMTFAAKIETDRRSVFDWLFSKVGVN